MKKYHIQVSVHPVVKDENGEEVIDHNVNNMSMMTQGDGFSKEEAIEILRRIAWAPESPIDAYTKLVSGWLGTKQ